ncbi:MAG: copper chaperone PCu(A)C [Litorimonas sp.]
MKHSILALSLITGFISACSGQDTGVAAQTVLSAEARTQGVSVSAPYVLPPFPGRDVAAGFFTLENHGAADRLISASSPDSASVEIHHHIEDNGVMRMRRIEGLALATGDVVQFEPGSYHLMLFGVNLPDDQSEIEVTLNYEKSDPMTLRVPIRQHGEEPETEQNKGSASHYGSGD